MTGHSTIDNCVLLTQSAPNPYAPGPAEIDRQRHGDEESLFVPYRIDRFAMAAILASLLDSISIGLILIYGTGVIGDPILGPLAAHSLFWIPIYRLAVPLLIPLMPQVCRQSFAIFYLAVGVLFSVNNFSGHFIGWFVFVETIGLYVSLAICFVPAIQAFGVFAIRSGKFARPLRITVAWIVIALMIQATFFIISRSF